MRTFVIAEAASAHDGQFDKAVRLIHAAAEAGAEACKFQYWSSPERLADRRRAPEYVDIYRRYQMPTWWLARLKAKCDAIGIEFMCTTFLPEDVAVVAPFVKRFKVSSFEASDVSFIEAHKKFRKAVVISIPGGQRLIHSIPDSYFLHCVSAYPSPFDQMNLGTIRRGSHNCGFDGLSDHSGLIETGAFAVCAGAEIIEVHVKLRDTDDANPDGGDFALLPDALGDYIALIRQAELMLGDGVKTMQPCEEPMAKYRVIA